MFKSLMQKVDRLLGRGVIDDELYDELEEALILADTHHETVAEILAAVRQAVRREKITTPEGIKDRLKEEIARRFDFNDQGRLNMAPSGVTVILIVGVNGAGKTTTIGKLAHRFRGQGKKVLLAAGDTFRAAAIDQLKIWAERTGSEFIGTKPGADSAAVIYDAVIAAQARGIDIVLADTAGRQHNKANLMAELAKIARACEKARGRGPDEALLILDANTGQNMVRQAEEFGATAGVTGIVLTKLDGTAKGGALIGLWSKLRVPVKLIGVGEKAEDLRDFDARAFAKELFD